MTLEESFRSVFGGPPTHLVRAPGRTELGGNHTDHNHGRVLAAAVTLGMRAAVRRAGGSTCTLISDGFPRPIIIECTDLHPRPEERGSSEALVRGVASALAMRGFGVGGFQARVSSQIAVGSGLSSSAAFEVLVGQIFGTLYNSHTPIPPNTLALACQEAENTFFGKPCGLMDQLCSAMGGTLKIDFRVPDRPETETVPFSPDASGFRLLVVNTGGSHEDLTHEYAAIPEEMLLVARSLGGATCRDLTREQLLADLPRLRANCGDRAVLRCLHFLEENERVERQADALRAGRFATYLDLVRASGESSLMLLQNGHSPEATRHQGIMMGIALTERFLSPLGTGACRVHGGGFAGTIQAYIPSGHVDAYKAAILRWFGEHAVADLSVSTTGAAAEPAGNR